MNGMEFFLSGVEADYCLDQLFQEKAAVTVVFSMRIEGRVVPAIYFTWGPELATMAETIQDLRKKLGQKVVHAFDLDSTKVSFDFEDGTKWRQKHTGLDQRYTSHFHCLFAELNPVPESFFHEIPPRTESELEENRRFVAEENRRFDETYNRDQVINGKVYSLGRDLTILDAVVVPKCASNGHGLRVTSGRHGETRVDDWDLPRVSLKSLETAAAFLRAKSGENVTIMSRRLPEAIYIKFDSGSEWLAEMSAPGSGETAKFLFLDFESRPQPDSDSRYSRFKCLANLT